MHCSAHRSGIAAAIGSQQLEAAEYVCFYTSSSFLLDIWLDLGSGTPHACFGLLDAIGRERVDG
eukprot:5628069-Pyramimonas_sp.AAC.1